MTTYRYIVAEYEPMPDGVTQNDYIDKTPTYWDVMEDTDGTFSVFHVWPADDGLEHKQERCFCDPQPLGFSTALHNYFDRRTRECVPTKVPTFLLDGRKGN
jgi:hypothetical protein